LPLGALIGAVVALVYNWVAGQWGGLQFNVTEQAVARARPVPTAERAPQPSAVTPQPTSG
jgi:hypothetical protein